MGWQIFSLGDNEKRLQGVIICKVREEEAPYPNVTEPAFFISFEINVHLAKAVKVVFKMDFFNRQTELNGTGAIIKDRNIKKSRGYISISKRNFR